MAKDTAMTIFCHDCEHWFSEQLAAIEADEMACPYCEGANWDGYPEED